MWEPYSCYVLDLCQTLLSEKPLVLTLILCRKPTCYKNGSAVAVSGVWPQICTSSHVLPPVWPKYVESHILKGHSAYPRLAKREAESQGFLIAVNSWVLWSQSERTCWKHYELFLPLEKLHVQSSYSFWRALAWMKNTNLLCRLPIELMQ